MGRAGMARQYHLRRWAVPTLQTDCDEPTEGCFWLLFYPPELVIPAGF